MHHLNLKDLPPPPPGKRGWPWTKESSPLPPTMPNGDPWPKISIVTPSFNQGQFIEETIRSVLLQNYPSLEYIIIDGGSTDNSVEIIKKYEPWLTYWVSEKDDGQSDAIHKGILKSTGNIIGWLNSDDFLLQNGIRILSELILNFSDAVAWACACYLIYEDSQSFSLQRPVVGNKFEFAKWEKGAQIAQPSCFFSRSAYLKVGGINKKLHFVMDVELWMKLSELGEFAISNKPISTARFYPGIKTVRDVPTRELEHIVISWNLGAVEEAKSRLIEFSILMIREKFFQLDFNHFIILVLTWVYRKTLKNFINKFSRSSLKKKSGL